MQLSKIPLPQLMISAQRGLTLGLSVEGKCVAMSIVERRQSLFELMLLAVDPLHQRQGYARELLFHTMDYIRLLGGKTLDAGAGNADIQSFLFLQRHGFRVVGVIPDHYYSSNARPEVENSIVNRDMIRYSADLTELAPQLPQ